MTTIAVYIFAGVGLMVAAFLSGYYSRYVTLNANTNQTGWRQRMPTKWRAGWFQGFSTEMVGALVTTVFLALWFGSAQARELRDSQRDQLILEMGSPQHIISTEAVRQLRVEGWLDDGSLRRAKLADANLEGLLLVGSDLRGADLRGVNFVNADLTDANLTGVDLRGADLTGAVLREADLTGADLSGANLSDTIFDDATLAGLDFTATTMNPAVSFAGADLSGANFHEENLIQIDFTSTDLTGANLTGANLFEAVLCGADLRDSRMDEMTILPDRMPWVGTIDMQRFVSC